MSGIVSRCLGANTHNLHVLTQFKCPKVMPHPHAARAASEGLNILCFFGFFSWLCQRLSVQKMNEGTGPCGDECQINMVECVNHVAKWPATTLP